MPRRQVRFIMNDTLTVRRAWQPRGGLELCIECGIYTDKCVIKGQPAMNAAGWRLGGGMRQNIA